MDKEKHFRQRAISELKNHQFIVEDYQRGYKWNYNQVLDLLNDINQFSASTDLQSYCLQPVAVTFKNTIKSTEENNKDINIYELVDGQQRLTTIYIILRLISDEEIFRIAYKTRESSKDFINDIHKLKVIVSHFKLYNESNKLKQAIDINNDLNVFWNTYIKDNNQFNNVDNYHFFRAACIISAFFNDDKINQPSFLSNLKNNVKIIWYEDITNKTANELFKNLNSGKIRLSSADMIKALFILNIEEKGKSEKLPTQIEFEQNKLAAEWDTIEQQLHEPEFWGFIIGNIKRDYKDSRIGYLLEVLTNTIEHPYTYQSYREFAKEPLEWNNVISLFFTLKEWYSDVYVYHRVGFLMRQNIPKWKNLKFIYEHFIASESKEDFRFRKLNQKVIDHFNDTKLCKNNDSNKIEIFRYDLNLLKYTDDLKDVRNLLVFLNILTYERVMPNYRINFDEFYNEKWTVEHIYPQNPKTMMFSECDTYIEEIINSLLSKKDTKRAQNDEEEIELLLKQIKIFKSERENVSFNDEKDFVSRLTNWISDNLTDLFQLHHIGNLTLLTQDVNSSIGNKPFTEKRRQIIEIFNKLGKKSFIPLSTLQIFTKSYSTENLQFQFWSTSDSYNYKASIAAQMNDYLPKPQN